MMARDGKDIIMNQALRAKCDQLVANDRVIKKAGFLESTNLVKLGSLLYTFEGATPDVERIKACRKILKGKVGIFSNFRGTLGFIVPVKMSLADDPEAYIDDTMKIYEQLTEGKLFAGEMLAMTALAIKDLCPAERSSEVVAKTREAYARMHKAHPILTNSYDMVLIALMCIMGSDIDATLANAEALYEELHARGLSGNASQSASMVLALTDAPAEQKVDDFLALYAALKDAKHATPRNGSMAIYAPFVGLDVPRDTIVSDISEVDTWLKGQKGYGAMGVGKTVRRLFAAAVTLDTYEGGVSSAPTTAAASAVAQTIVEQIVMVVTMIIIISAINAASASSK